MASLQPRPLAFRFRERRAEAAGRDRVEAGLRRRPGLLAAIHATASLGTADSMIEWRWFDLEATIYGDALSPKLGRISVPQGPWLGLDPNPDVISAYRWN